MPGDSTEDTEVRKQPRLQAGSRIFALAMAKRTLLPSLDYGKRTYMESDRVKGSSMTIFWVFFSPYIIYLRYN